MNKHELAKNISTLTNPPIICIPLFLIISLTLSFENKGFNISKFIGLELISLIFASVLPMAIIIHWARKLNTDGDISNRQDRFIPLIVGVVSYFIGFILSLIMNLDYFLTILLLCYSVNTAIVMIITLKWKISIHTTGLSGPVGALILLLGPAGALFGLIYPVLIWSRVTLKKHTMAQAITGGVQGFFLTVIEMHLFRSIFKLNISMISLESSILYILAIIITPVILGILTYTVDSRKIFLISELIIIILFLVFTPVNVCIIFLLTTIVSVLVSYYDYGDFAWFKILKSS